jgi:hypothetical protein
MNVIKKAAANHIDAFKNPRQLFVIVDENISCHLPSEKMSITFIPEGGKLGNDVMFLCLKNYV